MRQLIEKEKNEGKEEGRRKRCVMLTHVNARHKLFHLFFFFSIFFSLIPKQNSCFFFNSSLDALIFRLFFIINSYVVLYILSFISKFLHSNYYHSCVFRFSSLLHNFWLLLKKYFSPFLILLFIFSLLA